jgi:hypothetical protein
MQQFKKIKNKNLYYYKQTEHRIYLALWHELLTLGFVKVTRAFVKKAGLKTLPNIHKLE